MSLCGECSSLLHAKGKFREHQVTPLGNQYGVIPMADGAPPPSSPSPSAASNHTYGVTPTGIDRDRDRSASNPEKSVGSPQPQPPGKQPLPASLASSSSARRSPGSAAAPGRRGPGAAPPGAMMKRSVSIVPSPQSVFAATSNGTGAVADTYGALPVARDPGKCSCSETKWHSGNSKQPPFFAFFFKKNNFFFFFFFFFPFSLFARCEGAPAQPIGSLPGYGSLPTAEDAARAKAANANANGNGDSTAAYGRTPGPVKAGGMPAAATVPSSPGDSNQYKSVPAAKAPSSGYGDLPPPAAPTNQYGDMPIAAAGGDEGRWQPLRDTEGRLYYVNSLTGETSWTKPDTNAKRAAPVASYQHLSQVKPGDKNRSRSPPKQAAGRVGVVNAMQLPIAARGGGGPSGGGGGGAGGGGGGVDARLRAATSPVRPSNAARALSPGATGSLRGTRRLEKSGWLSKNGKQRWFLLREQMLYWFVREQAAGADVTRDVRNFLDLSGGFNVRPNFQSKRGAFELVIEPAPPLGAARTPLVLACQSQGELDSWISALSDGRARGSEARIAGFVRINRQRMFALLDASQLRLFADETRAALRAAIDLGGCAPLGQAYGDTLTLKSASGQSYDLAFSDAAQAAEWRVELVNVQRKQNEVSQLKRAVTQRKVEQKGSGGIGGGGGGGPNGSSGLSSGNSSMADIVVPLADGELPPMKEARTSEDILDMPFFHRGRISAENAYDMLVGHRVGSYLVRESSRQGCYVVSWIQSDDAIVHTLLAPASSGNGWTIEGDDRLYGSIMSILATYSMSYRFAVNA
jgi:hypothetical protein